ncbi:DnaB-like helicase N-terminal domain-containing protein [Streptomyces cyaneofuscatus]|uniref:DnaB-like helicase N-terminal domain-containing protein n=1 Tax=Streptomyces cyaneofuscatus TaxID=66883 RepID=UPI0033B24FD7
MPLDPDDILEPASPRAGHIAEQALLGALFLQPALIAEVDLEPLHFDNRTHAVLFAAMRAVPLPDPEHHRENVDWVAAVYAEARPQAPGLPHTYPHTLVQACQHPEHAATYAWMIRAGHARRTLRVHAGRLAQTAADTTLPNQVDATVTQANQLGNLLDQLSGRFAPHPGSLPRTPLPPESAPEASEEAVDDERLLLATATGSPQTVQTMRWLAPADFTSALHGSLWRCITGLVHRGAPVDPVTVLWEAEQSGLLTSTATARSLLELLSDTHGEPDHWGEKIVRRALLHRARTVAGRIVAIADDPATTPHQMITGSRRALADLTALRNRWQSSTAPTPPTTPRAPRSPAVTRAGPPPRATAARALR